MLKTVIISLLILKSGICLQKAVNNVENPEKADQNPTTEIPKVQLTDPNKPKSNANEDAKIKEASTQGATKKAAVGLTPQQLDALADKILQIHGVEPQAATPQNFARAERLRNVVSNVENKLENKLKEAAEQANEETLRSGDIQLGSLINIDVTGEEPLNEEDVKESNNQSNDENNNDIVERNAVEQPEAEENDIKEKKGLENETGDDSDIRQENTDEIKEIEPKQEPEQPLAAQTENAVADETVTNDEQYTKNLEHNEKNEPSPELELSHLNAATEEDVENKVAQEGTQKIPNETEINENILIDDAHVVSDQSTDETEESEIEQKREPAETQQDEPEDRTKDVTEEDSQLQGTETDTEDDADQDTDSPDTTPILTLGQVQPNPENKTTEDPENSVHQVDIPDLDTISPTPTFKEEDLKEEILKTKDTSLPEEETDETDLETCNAEESDCDKEGKNHLYSAQNNKVDEALLEATTESGYFRKVLNFIYDRF